MQAGKLDRRLTLISVGSTNTGAGITQTDLELGTVWASRADLSDAEKAAAGSVQSLVRTRFLTWSSTLTRSLKPKDRLIEGGRKFEILGIKESGRDLLEITAEARLD